ncbi:MAG: polyphosphate polymerase domain-containing protein [Acidimicrobiales bacterium]
MTALDARQQEAVASSTELRRAASRPSRTVRPDSDLDRALGQLEPVSLPELLVAAELLTRADRKYLLHQSVLPEMVDHLDASVRALEIDEARTFRYESMYFDTPDLVSYHEHATLRPDRYKVRTRAYLDSTTCSLEVKTRDHRGLTVKARVDHAIDERAVLTEAGRRFVSGFEFPARHVDRLVPTLWTKYRRATLLLSADTRATLDTGLVFETPAGEVVSAGEWAVVESKSMGKPTVVDRTLWAMGHRPVLLSKYVLGMAMHHPDLPAHRWNRVLRRDLGWGAAAHPQRPVVRRGRPA